MGSKSNTEQKTSRNACSLFKQGATLKTPVIRVGVPFFRILLGYKSSSERRRLSASLFGEDYWGFP